MASKIPAPRGVSASAGSATVVPPPPMGRTVSFITSDDSPFPDRYSIEAEAKALAYMDDLSDADQLLDPNFARLEMLYDRRERLARMRDEFQGYKGADKRVPYADTQKLDQLGRLVTADDESDTIELHTRQAFRVFVGRRADPERKLRPIPSAKRIGTVLKVLHDLSRFDNPYADWALLRADEHITHIRDVITQVSGKFKQHIAELADRGMRIGILRSANPQKFQLQFRSPYGYMLCELLVDFDYFVRVVMTMVAKGQLSDDQVRPTLSPIIGHMRSFFMEMVRYERVLANDNLRMLSRRDYLPDAGPEAQKRIEAVTEIFGIVPAEVFKGEIVPTHTKRRTDATEQDVVLLGRIYEQLTREAENEGEADANGNEKADANSAALL